MLRSIRDAQNDGSIRLIYYRQTEEKEVATWEKRDGGFKTLTHYLKCGTIIEENVH